MPAIPAVRELLTLSDMLRAAAAVFVLLTSHPVSAAVEWIPRGPEGGTIVAFGTAETEPRILAGTHEGKLFASRDGTRWTRVGRGLGGTTIRRIVISPRTALRVWVLTDDGLYRSGDYGNTFLRRLGAPVNDFAVAFGDPDVVYAATGASIVRSTDGGITWTTPANAGLPRSVSTVDADASDAMRVWTIDPVSPSSPLLSTNGGESWERVPKPEAAIGKIVTHKRIGGIVFAWGSRDLYRSTDGVSWTRLAITPEFFAPNPLAFDWFLDRRLYLDAGLGVYRSDDLGDSAQLMLRADVRAVATDPFRPDTVYVGLTADGVTRTTDAGRSWSAASEGLIASQVYAVVSDARNDRAAYAATATGLYKTADGGRTWHQIHGRMVPGPSGAIQNVAIDPTDSRNVWISSMYYLRYSRDAGATWSAPQTFPNPVLVNSITVDERGIVWVTTSGRCETATAGEIWKSTDGGERFRSVGPKLDFADSVFTVVVENEQSIWAGGATDWNLRGLILHSEDGGQTWTDVSPAGVPPVYSMYVTPDTILAGVGRDFGRGAEIVRSDDRGISWTRSDSGLPAHAHIVSSIVRDRDLIYASLSTAAELACAASVRVRGGVTVSSDGGHTWTNVSGDMEGIGVSALSHNARYASTLGLGVFIRDDDPGKRRAVRR
jgi:photosystem II stability/assembly factor-like uncharacterized protein